MKEPVDLIGKASKDIDVIQHRHRYSLVAPSWNHDAQAHYVWYDAEGAPMDSPPHLDDLEYLPEAWVDFLRMPEVGKPSQSQSQGGQQSHSGQQWDGELPEVASPEEECKLRSIVSSLQELPADGSAGSGWHDTVIRAAGWLARIARSNAYALTFEQAHDLLLQHTPTDESQGGVADLERQWQSMVKSTEGQFEEPPAPPVPPLLPWAGFPLDQEFPLVRGDLFFSTWSTLPENQTPTGRWGRRRQLLESLLAHGFSDPEAATIVWHSAAAQHPGFTFAGVLYLDEHSKCITEEELWREVQAAKEGAATAQAEASGDRVEAAPAENRPGVTVAPELSLLSADERLLIEGDAGEWWGRRFMQWAADTFGEFNEAYFRANRWTALSVIFAPYAVLPFKGGLERPLNLYQILVGPTTSGKSTALRVVEEIFKNYFLLTDDPDIGGDFTPEALGRELIKRDGSSSWAHVDEAHTVMTSKWRRPGGGPYTGVPGALTDLYDGKQGKVLRVTDQESNKRARVFLILHLMGTEEGMVDAIEPDDWSSGLIPRFVWTRGRSIPRSKETIADGWVTEDHLNDDPEVATKVGRKMYAQWAAEFGGAVQRINRGEGKTTPISLPKDVMARFGQFAWSLQELALTRVRFVERLKATLDRLAESTLRAASLVALSQGRLRLEMSDLLIAIEQAEEWTVNALVMVEATDESVRTRRVNAIEQAVIRGGGKVSLASIHREFPNKRLEIEGYLAELIAQGRVGKNVENGIDMVILKGVTTEGGAS